MYTHVYFLHCPEMNRVKIGRSDDPLGRFMELRRYAPAPLYMAGYYAAPKEEEKRVHEMFAHLHRWQEWFEFAPELQEYIEAKSELLAEADEPPIGAIAIAKTGRWDYYYRRAHNGWKRVSARKALRMIERGTQVVEYKRFPLTIINKLGVDSV